MNFAQTLNRLSVRSSAVETGARGKTEVTQDLFCHFWRSRDHLLTDASRLISKLQRSVVELVETTSTF